MDEEKTEEIQEMLEDALENIKDELLDQMNESIQEAMNDSLSEIITEALEDYFASRAFTLPDGTVLQPREHLKVLSPDKRKLLICYGGLKVDGKTLVVQTRISSWQSLCYFSTEEEAAAALLKIKDAMQAGEKYLEL